MELIAGESKLTFNEADSLLVIEGSMRLANLMEYDKVGAFLMGCAEKSATKLTIDMRKLTFLNSSGITTLSMCILNLKKKQTPKLLFLGSLEFAWQEKSLKNFTKLWADASVEIG
jgi:hypothetical protein